MEMFIDSSHAMVVKLPTLEAHDIDALYAQITIYAKHAMIAWLLPHLALHFRFKLTTGAMSWSRYGALAKWTLWYACFSC
jgi:hypothetical protein